MAKKRSMPGHSAPKAKKHKTRAYSAPPDVAQGEATPLTARPPAPSYASAPGSALRSATPIRSRSGATGLSTDYRYVVSDLKRIAVIAGATFVILFGLTFVVK